MIRYKQGIMVWWSGSTDKRLNEKKDHWFPSTQTHTDAPVEACLPEARLRLWSPSFSPQIIYCVNKGVQTECFPRLADVVWISLLFVGWGKWKWVVGPPLFHHLLCSEDHCSGCQVRRGEKSQVKLQCTEKQLLLRVQGPFKMCLRMWVCVCLKVSKGIN